MPGLIVLYLEFFKVGLFSVGGGFAILPFLYELADKYPWFSREDVSNMLAISQSTPGPVGINMATYAGFQNYGLIGGLIATLGIITPTMIIVLIISRFLKQFSESIVVTDIFYALRPTVVGLLGAVGIGLILDELINKDKLMAAFASFNSFAQVFNLKQIIFFIIVFILTNKFKKHPLFYIAASVVVGLIVKF